MDTTNLVSWLSFDESATADKCGKTWTATGNVSLSSEIKKFGAASVHLPNGAYLTANNIGKRVENYLRAVGYETKLFQFDGLQEICDDANAWHADLFVSIHQNAPPEAPAFMRGEEGGCLPFHLNF